MWKRSPSFLNSISLRLPATCKADTLRGSACHLPSSTVCPVHAKRCWASTTACGIPPSSATSSSVTEPGTAGPKATIRRPSTLLRMTPVPCSSGNRGGPRAAAPRGGRQGETPALRRYSLACSRSCGSRGRAEMWAAMRLALDDLPGGDGDFTPVGGVEGPGGVLAEVREFAGLAGARRDTVSFTVHAPDGFEPDVAEPEDRGQSCRVPCERPHSDQLHHGLHDVRRHVVHEAVGRPEIGLGDDAPQGDADQLLGATEGGVDAFAFDAEHAVTRVNPRRHGAVAQPPVFAGEAPRERRIWGNPRKESRAGLTRA